MRTLPPRYGCFQPGSIVSASSAWFYSTFASPLLVCTASTTLWELGSAQSFNLSREKNKEKKKKKYAFILPFFLLFTTTNHNNISINQRSSLMELTSCTLLSGCGYSGINSGRMNLCIYVYNNGCSFQQNSLWRLIHIFVYSNGNDQKVLLTFQPTYFFTCSSIV